MSADKASVAVAGGGAAGLMAAIAAAGAGAGVTVLEKMPRAGLKLRITGNGRCNLSTLDGAAAAAAAFGPNGRFLRGAFARFFSAELVALMESIDVPVTSEPGRGYYPRSNRATDVADALARHAAELGVEFATGSAVESVVVEDGRAAGVVTASGEIRADRVILATGGVSYPKTGSTGDGYRIAAELGHTVVPPLPACVPVTLSGELHKRLAPLTFPDVEAKLSAGGKIVAKSRGGMLFTPWGATGPASLALSKAVARTGADGLERELSVNFFPGHDTAGVGRMLADAISSGGRAGAVTALEVFFPRRAAGAFAEAWGLPPGRMCCHVTTAERARLAGMLSGCIFPITGTRPLDEAMVTAGGVSLREVDPKTMESKVVSGLYICGELLDLDAGTGGYNLQAAFSTGFTAGTSAAGAG